jgi:hypothetical protein
MVTLLSRKIHALLDYPSSVLLIMSPWVFNFRDIRPASNVAITVGIMMLVMSIFTNYEGGLKKVIAMSTHLYADIIVGSFLALSPWLFFFYEDVYLPHLILGLLAVVAGLTTERKSYLPTQNDLTKL